MAGTIEQSNAPDYSRAFPPPNLSVKITTPPVPAVSGSFEREVTNKKKFSKKLYS